ncbi:hypothetical protein [Cryobacterium sp. Hz9]|uniref:hypothetical protein n=1 Tax=Cryobacterium sp. Hz9 TaxID=1259167 RepID=UPI001069B77C|nr:hypothetical protein [Cryobacterium sp. Hz9]TFB66180.1 hypothetical protein E3N85_10080 [Cryobacterium sp. Hz9]
MHPRSTLASELLDHTPEDYVSHHVIDRVPAIFSDRQSYIDWKKSIAEGLQVDPYGVILVGSACTGFSLSPQKNFREFNARSDLDVAVISDRHFDEAWRYLRDLGSDVHKLPLASKRAVNSHRSGHVFDGVIATDQFVQYLPFGKTWVPVLERATISRPADGRQVKVRLYRDLFALRSYQRRGVEEARTRLIGDQT